MTNTQRFNAHESDVRMADDGGWVRYSDHQKVLQEIYNVINDHLERASREYMDSSGSDREYWHGNETGLLMAVNIIKEHMEQENE